jgi:transcription elongation factor Elf1
MDFLEAFEIMNDGGSVTNQDTDSYFVWVDGAIERRRSTGETITRYDMVPYGFLKRHDWEIAEVIQEIKIQTTISEIYTCPSCKINNEYFNSDKKAYKEFGHFKCGKCGQKIKPKMQTDADLLDYIQKELGRDFKNLYDAKYALIGIITDEPDLITFNNNGKIIKYEKIK